MTPSSRFRRAVVLSALSVLGVASGCGDDAGSNKAAGGGAGGTPVIIPTPTNTLPPPPPPPTNTGSGGVANPVPTGTGGTPIFPPPTGGTGAIAVGGGGAGGQPIDAGPGDAAADATDAAGGDASPAEAGIRPDAAPDALVTLDARVTPDVISSADAATLDAGTTVDSSGPDTSTVDAGTVDTGEVDTGAFDAGIADTGTADAADVTDAGPIGDCGNGSLQPGEQCDTGRANGSGGCSALCQLDGVPPNSSCSAAQVIGRGRGGTFTGTTTGAASDYSAYSGVCSAGTATDADGPDVAYRLTLGANWILNATVAGGTNHVLALASDCALSAATCVNTADNTQNGGSETIVYTNATGSPRDLVLLVDGRLSISAGDFTLTLVMVPPVVCGDGFVQGGEQCDDGNQRDADGCSSGCVPEYAYTCDGAEPSVCTPPPSVGQLGAGGSINHVHTTPITAGSTLRLSVEVTEPLTLDGSLVRTSAGDVDLAFLAADGSPLFSAENAGDETFGPQVLDAGVYLIDVTAFVVTGDVDGFTLNLSGGSAPEVFSCQDRIAVTLPDTLNGDTSAGAINTYSGYASQCPGGQFQSTGAGPDVPYSFTLANGETLTATLTSAADLSMMLTVGCTDFSTQCLRVQDAESGGTPEVLTYTNNSGAPQALALIVDGYGGASGAYTLDLNVN